MAHTISVKLVEPKICMRAASAQRLRGIGSKGVAQYLHDGRLDLRALQREIHNSYLVNDDETVEISGVALDHRMTQPGDLFCALRGAKSDGTDFIGLAQERGAKALMVAHHVNSDLPQLVVPERQMRREVARASDTVYGHPSRQLKMIGVTGTNGKTTVVHLLSQVLSRLGSSCRELGTLWGRLTTPEAPDLHRQLRMFVDQGATFCAMEVSSIALEMHRVDFVDFDVAIFTNLSQDHMDLHGTMEEYFAAKSKLFQLDYARQAVIGTSDLYGKRLYEQVTIPKQMASLDALSHYEFSRDGVRFRYFERDFFVPLLGEHNLMNALCALETMRHFGYDLDRLVDVFREVSEPTGRLQFVISDAPYDVVIDYAHTPAALEAALGSLRVRVGPNARLICVVGCGGDRDRQKRPDMGKIATDLSDLAIFTSDNPRSEPPSQILLDITSEIPRSLSYEVIEDRQEAIRFALEIAKPGDVVLIAGKGHENKQVVGDIEIPFSDFEVSRGALASLGWTVQ